MEIVVIAPHVLPRADNSIRLALRVVGRESGFSDATDVRLAIEDPDRTLSSARAGEAADQREAGRENAKERGNALHDKPP
jgi:hypothetical protein